MGTSLSFSAGAVVNAGCTSMRATGIADKPACIWQNSPGGLFIIVVFAGNLLYHAMAGFEYRYVFLAIDMELCREEV